jgi:hypothetical protein
VKYLVLEDPQVTLTVNGFSTKVQRDYLTVKAILSETPRGAPRFTAVTEGYFDSGLRYYQYLDGVLPFVLQYRVFDADNDWQRGLVWISDADPI